MIKFQKKKNQNIIALVPPQEIKYSHKQRSIDQSVRKWNVGKADFHQKSRKDRKNQIMMTKQFELYCRKQLFSNRRIQAHITTSESQNYKNEIASSSLKKYSIDGGFMFSQRQVSSSLSKGFPQQLKKNRYLLKNANVSKTNKFIRTQQLVRKLTAAKQMTVHEKKQFTPFQNKKHLENCFNDIFLKKKTPYTLQTQPTQIRNVCSFAEEDFLEANKQPRVSIASKVKSHRKLQRSSIKVCYSRKGTAQNLDHFFNQAQS